MTRVARDSDLGGNTNTFAYDHLNRLTAETGLVSAGATKTYAYDLDGNRTAKTEGATSYAYEYEPTDELVAVTKTGGTRTVFGYDARGNMTTDAEAGDVAIAIAYTYDLGDKLTLINTAGTTSDASFTYDALGRLLTRSVSSSPTATVDSYAYTGTADTVVGIATTGGPGRDRVETQLRPAFSSKGKLTCGVSRDGLRGQGCCSGRQPRMRAKPGSANCGYGPATRSCWTPVG